MIVVTNWRDRSHPRAGGAEAVCEHLAADLAARGHEVVLLAAAVTGCPRVERRDGYLVRRAGGTYTCYLHALLWLLVHRRQVESVVDSQNGIPYFTPLAVRRRTAVLLLLHHVHQDQFGLYFPPVVARVGRFFESTVSRWVYRDRSILAVSPSTRRGARRELGLRGAIHVTPPGMSVQPRPGERLRSARPTIVCVGRFVPHKRYDAVVEAFAPVAAARPDVALHLVGSGPEAERIEALVRRRGLQERVAVHVGASDAERDALLSTAWLTVNASQGEGWGISVIEANALGVPVLAYDRPGLRDSVRPGRTGWLLPEGASLEDGIATALDAVADEVEAARLSAEAVAWAGRFTWPAMTDKILAAIELEHHRLAYAGRERRGRTDAAVVVELPAGVVAEAGLRASDSVEVGADGGVLLLPGADTATAEQVLRRVGVDPDVCRIRAPRTHDHMRPWRSRPSPSSPADADGQEGEVGAEELAS